MLTRSTLPLVVFLFGCQPVLRELPSVAETREDTDRDGIVDLADACPTGESDWSSSPDSDRDTDGCRDATEDDDDDDDGLLDFLDACASGELGWTSGAATDHDSDGCEDASEDSDDDDDGTLDQDDACETGDAGWRTAPESDHDADGCRDATEDEDDDADVIQDPVDACPRGVTAWASSGGVDLDGDGCIASEDVDDDDDGVLDYLDGCATGVVGWGSDDSTDHDQDGCRDADEDDDDDGDGVGDASDGCSRGDRDWSSAQDTDHDLDGCRDAVEDDDDDDDGVEDGSDLCPRGLETWDGEDHDGDGCGPSEDVDDDEDGVLDFADACPSGSLGVGADRDGDGCADSEENDDDNDDVIDGLDLCPRGDAAWSSNALTDHDADGCRDALEDQDDDNDGALDANDTCAEGEVGWLSSEDTDHDDDGCQDVSEDGDDDDDLVLDGDDACALGVSFVSNAASDHDHDGCADASEDDDDDNDGVSDVDDADDDDPSRCADIDDDGCDDCARGADGVGPEVDFDVLADGDDADLDGLCDLGDSCPFVADAARTDSDNDGIADACDGIPELLMHDAVVRDAYGINAFAQGDIDRDGDLDLYVSSASGSGGPAAFDGASRVFWLENLGRGSAWKRRAISTTLVAPTSLVSADIDGDGDPDAVVRTASALIWLENTAAGTVFVTHTVANGAGAAKGADLDRDGDIDLVSTNASGTVWYENDTNGTSWTEHAISGTALAIMEVVDMDRDLDVDVLVASGSDVFWLESDAGDASSFSQHTVALAVPAGLTRARAGDLDGDGDVDVLTTSFGGLGSSGILELHENLGGDAWLSHELAIVPQMYTAALGDLDKDGDLDALIGTGVWETGVPSNLMWVENPGSVSAAWRQHPLPMVMDAWVFGVEIADVDGDADLDALAFSSSDGLASYTPETISWYENLLPHRGVRFEGATSLASVSSAQRPLIADFDRDGGLDFAVEGDAPNGDRGIYILSDGDGEWSETLVRTDANLSIGAVGDINGDGYPDIAGSHTYEWWGVTSWYENLPESLWGEHVLIGFGGGAVASALADLDGDRHLDLPYYTLYFANVNGDGSAMSQVPLIPTASILAAADVDKDGDNDLFAGNTVLQWLSNDSGAWSVYDISSAGGAPSSVVAADLDRDGDPDALVVDARGLVVEENTAGDGTAWRSTIVSDLPGAGTAFVADMDTDGDLDIVTPTSPRLLVAWYENAGDGRTFERHLTGIATEDPLYGAQRHVEVAAGDLTRDGATDFAMTLSQPVHLGASGVYLVPNTGGQFALSAVSLGATSASAGALLPLFRVDAEHRGQPNDLSAVVTGIRLRFTDGAGTPLDTAELAARLSSVAVYLDTTTGEATPTFEPGRDTLVVSLAAPNLDANGEALVRLPTDAGRFTPRQVKRFYVAASAASQASGTLRVTVVLAGGSRVYDARDFMAMTLEAPADVGSLVITLSP